MRMLRESSTETIKRGRITKNLILLFLAAGLACLPLAASADDFWTTGADTRNWKCPPSWQDNSGKAAPKGVFPGFNGYKRVDNAWVNHHVWFQGPGQTRPPFLILGSLTVNPRGIIEAQGTNRQIKIQTTEDLTVNEGGKIIGAKKPKSPSIDLRSGGGMSISGTINGKIGTINLTDTGNKGLTIGPSGTVQNDKGDFNGIAKKGVKVNGNVNTAGNAKLGSATGQVVVSGKVTSKGNTEASSKKDVKVSGSITSGKNTTIKSKTGEATVSGTLNSKKGHTNVTAKGPVTISGTIDSGKHTTIKSESDCINIRAGAKVTSRGDISIEGADASKKPLVIDGYIKGKNVKIIYKGGTVIVNGKVEAEGTLTIKADKLIVNGDINYKRINKNWKEISGKNKKLINALTPKNNLGKVEQASRKSGDAPPKKVDQEPKKTGGAPPKEDYDSSLDDAGSDDIWEYGPSGTTYLHEQSYDDDESGLDGVHDGVTEDAESDAIWEHDSLGETDLDEESYDMDASGPDGVHDGVTEDAESDAIWEYDSLGETDLDEESYDMDASGLHGVHDGVTEDAESDVMWEYDSLGETDLDEESYDTGVVEVES